MARTPDDFPGERIDESILFDSGSGFPTKSAQVMYATGTISGSGFFFNEEGVIAGPLSGMHASGSGIWSADVAPAVPHADDIETWTSWPPTGWAEFDQNNTLTPSVADGFLILTNATHATVHNRCVYRACPTAGEWSVWAKVTMGGVEDATTDQWGCGILVAADIVGAPTTCKVAGVELANYASGGSYGFAAQGGTFTSYLRGGGVTLQTPGYNLFLPNSIYLRFGYDGTNFTAFWSIDGICWIRIGQVAKTFTPLYTGFVVRNNMGNTVYHYIDFYRVVIGAGSSGLGAPLFRGSRI